MKPGLRALWETVDSMRDFFFGAAAVLLALVAIGLFRILAGPRNADRMMAAQLLGAGALRSCFWPLGAGSLGLRTWR